ncbi:acyl carrier protein phosphodiesterase [Taibaiella helva]|uniref:acyl carrier protein phosphodiesterase n=1 Tax=Taibaiella helva TaxID=2301235 RepID=UPI001300B819|nr:ACP phosphodiesterase [Taibaiella helva]
MNYLGHALLSFKHPEILAGNMIGDFVKGSKALDNFPEGIRQGLLLHRKIDSFADAHPATLKAKNLFRPDYRLYSGAFVDSLYDHFLANDPHYFAREKDLFDFAREVYETLQQYGELLPEGFRRMLPYMVSDNWLYSYRTLKGMQNAFRGLARRAQYIESSDKAYEILVGHYYELNQYYFDFMDDVSVYVKNELNGISPGL